MKQVVGALVLGGMMIGGCGGDASPNVDTRAPLQNLAPANDHSLPQSAQVATKDPLPTSQPSVAGMDELVATINNQPLTMRQFMTPLIEAHGLTMLLNLVRVELARQDADKAHITVSTRDFADERQSTLDKMFSDSRPEQTLREKLESAKKQNDQTEVKRLQDEIESQRQEFLVQFLQDRHISPVEFDLVIRMNTYLRKIAEPQIKSRITDADLRSAFGQLYGETARVRYIELHNMDEVRKAQRRIAAGDTFEDVARDMSYNRASAALGGEMPPFSRAAQNLPDSFKDVAFSLRPGQVSDPVTVGTSYLLLKLVEKIPPKAVKFETVKESVRATLYDKLEAAAVRQLRESLDQQVIADMKIREPELKKQFQAMIDRQIHDRQKMKEAMERDRLTQSATTEPTSQPTMQPEPSIRIPAPTLPSLAEPSTAPAAGDDRPPATQPGSVERPVQ